MMFGVAAIVLVAAAAGAQDVVRTEPPNGTDRPAALAVWRWPDCKRVLATEASTFAEAMCNAAASRTRLQSATDIADANAVRYRTETLGHLRRAATLASSPAEKRVALSELAVTYSGVAGDLPLADLAWREVIALAPDDPTGYLALAQLQHRRGALAEEEATLIAARQASTHSSEIVEALARLYRSRGRADDAIRAIREYVELDPADARRYWLLATWYWQIQGMPELSSRAADFTAAGLKTIDIALTLQPDYVDALTCKYTLLRRQAELAPDAAARQAALAAAAQVRARVLELQKR